MKAQSMFNEASDDAKLIVASNLAVIQAMLHASLTGRGGGTYMMYPEQQALGFLQSGLDLLSGNGKTNGIPAKSV